MFSNTPIPLGCLLGKHSIFSAGEHLPTTMTDWMTFVFVNKEFKINLKNPLPHIQKFEGTAFWKTLILL